MRPDKAYQTIRDAAVTGFCVLFLVSGFAEANTEQRLNDLRKQLSASSNRQQEISQRLSLVSGEIAALKAKLASSALKIKDLDQNLVEIEQRLDDIADVEKQTLDRLSQQNTDLADTLSALIHLSRQPENSLIGSPQDLIDTLRVATLLRAAIPSIKGKADELNGQLETLASLREQYLQEQENFLSVKSARKSEREVLDQLLRSKKQAQQKLFGRNSRENQRQEKLSREAENLVALLSKLEADKQQRLAAEKERIEREIREQEELRRQEEARISAEIKRAKEEERIAAENANRVPTPTPSRKNDVNLAKTKSQKPAETLNIASLGSGKPFSTIKGTLPLPVGGKIVSNFTKTQKNLQRSGIIIETRDGATVVSPYDGQIAFAGPFRQYGLLLIIDHGEGYHTLLAGLGDIEGEVGQLLLAGEPVGTMNGVKSGKPTLYMELRAKGSPINPVPWFAAGYRKVSG